MSQPYRIFDLPIYPTTPLTGTEFVEISNNGNGSFRVSLAAVSSGTAYYVSPSGNDSNGGTSPGAPIKTIAAVNALSLVAGDSVLFQGGQTFSGAIVCPSSGTPANPITFGSYGGGQATISSGTSNGFTSTSQAGIIVRDLTFSGSSSANHGVLFQNQLAGNVHLQNIQAINLNVSGYGGNGILVLGGTATSKSCGYDDIIIRGCNVTSCCSHVFGDPPGTVNSGTLGIAGINIYSAYGQGLAVNSPSHRNIIIENCYVASCLGVTDLAWSGSGIVVSEVSDCIVRHCEANSNGANSIDTQFGGSVGIWCADCVRVVFQSCKSISQSTANGQDGGGFDLDGGCTDCAIIDCFTTGNQNYGYVCYGINYIGMTAHSLCRIINCVSDTDFINTNWGGIYLFTQGTTISGLEIANCMVNYAAGSGGFCINTTNTAGGSMTGNVTNCGFNIVSGATRGSIGTIVSGINISGLWTYLGTTNQTAQFLQPGNFGTVQATYFTTGLYSGNFGGVYCRLLTDNSTSTRAFLGLDSADHGEISLGAGGSSATNPDIVLSRGGAGILTLAHQSDASSATTGAAGLFCYNTATGGVISPSGYERGIFDWTTNSNVLTIGTQAAGGGVARNLEFIVGGSNVADYGITVSSKWSMAGGIYSPFLFANAASGNFGGLYVILPTDTGYPSGTNARIVAALDGSNNPAIGLGPGGASPTDTFLNRQGANTFGVGTSTTNTAGSIIALFFETSTPLISTGGGGGNPTLTASSTGGTGQPTTAAQNSWLKMKDSGGNVIWLPVWK